MIRYSQVTDEYFTWLIGLVDGQHKPQYSDVLYALFDTEFVSKLRKDENRIGDGLELRSEYTASQGLTDIFVGPCTVLEVMVSLARRAEDDFMYDPEKGDRTAKWFWIMVKNLGLDDLAYEWGPDDRLIFDHIIGKFINRRYDSDGKGGLFYIKNCPQNLARVELWNQLCWFLDEFEE